MGVKEEGLLFVNKKKQKNFVTWDSACGDDSATCAVPGSKSFLVLFFKKEALLFPFPHNRIDRLRHRDMMVLRHHVINYGQRTIKWQRDSNVATVK